MMKVIVDGRIIVESGNAPDSWCFRAAMIFVLIHFNVDSVISRAINKQKIIAITTD